MKLRTMIDLFTELEKVHGNLELLAADPTQATDDGVSRWTPDFLPFVTEALNEDGIPEKVGLLIAKPQLATVVDAEGNEVQPIGV